MAYTAYGYGDSATWGGAVPYWEQPDRYNHWCEHCGEGMDDYDGEWGEWCSFKCWYEDNRGAVKTLIIKAIDITKVLTVDNVIWNLKHCLDFDLQYLCTVDSFERFKRAIQNRINEKAANSNTKSGLIENTA